MISVTVNGIAMSSKEIPEVSGTGHIYTAPKLGYPPAVGVTRDLTIIDSDSGEWVNAFYVIIYIYVCIKCQVCRYSEMNI